MHAIFIAKQDVFLDEIPEFYQESLKQFLFGCTCMVVDGRIKYYYIDFLKFYTKLKL